MPVFSSAVEMILEATNKQPSTRFRDGITLSLQLGVGTLHGCGSEAELSAHRPNRWQTVPWL